MLEALITIRNRLTALKKVRLSGGHSHQSRAYDRTQPSLSAHRMSCRSTTRWSSRVSQIKLDLKHVLTQVTRLNAIRDEHSESSLSTNPSGSSSSTPGPAPPEPNRVDTILADVFGLLSLFFLTIGKSRETPATYSQIASMRVSCGPQRGLKVLHRS